MSEDTPPRPAECGKIAYDRAGVARARTALAAKKIWVKAYECEFCARPGVWHLTRQGAKRPRRR